MESIKEIRLILIIGTLFSLFFNIFDSINQNVPLIDFIFYSGTLLVIFLILVLTTNKWTIVFSLSIVGMFTIIDIPTPNYLSAGIAFFIFSIRIADNFIYSFCIYFITILIVVGTHVYYAISPADAVNVLIAYAVIYLLDYLLYNNSKRN